MRTYISIFAVLLIACIGYLTYAHFSGGSVPTFGLPLGGERAQIRLRTLSFFEHVKFKNASALEDFVSATSGPEELTHYLLTLLGIGPDQIDLHHVTIEHVELNTAETRARARVTFTGQDLSQQKPFSLSKIIFLFKNTEGVWLVDIKSVAPASASAQALTEPVPN